MRTADLGDRVVAVADEDALVEPRGALALGAVEGPATGRLVLSELLAVEPAQRARIARVAGKERALDRLGEVDEAKDGTVEVREMGPQELLLGVVKVSTGYLTAVDRSDR